MSADEMLDLINRARDADIKANQVVINNHLDAADRVLGQLAVSRVIRDAPGVAESTNPLSVTQ